MRHSNEEDVARALCKEKHKRQQMISKIANAGVFNYNTTILQQGYEKRIVGRAAETYHIVEDYLPCSSVSFPILNPNFGDTVEYAFANKLRALQ